MAESLITTALDDALISLRNYEPTAEWGETGARMRRDVAVAHERELNLRVSQRVLDALYHVSQDFIRIELGLL